MARARELLAKVGLSGKRIAIRAVSPAGSSIARALAMRPDVICLMNPPRLSILSWWGGAQHHPSAGAGKTHHGDRDP
ncbi:hypothetical protein J4734_14220 [Klebsiella pneumoniae]|uniref:Uncharacterized protein n=1 Tax=Klebsiella pneumoniae TaxID=573 RepID=A0A939NQ17_KLEPN|nr:hypothetical protein [Klebsiella pneumoniae]